MNINPNLFTPNLPVNNQAANPATLLPVNVVHGSLPPIVPRTVAWTLYNRMNNALTAAIGFTDRRPQSSQI